jgi:hypothetical protein
MDWWNEGFFGTFRENKLVELISNLKKIVTKNGFYFRNILVGVFFWGNGELMDLEERYKEWYCFFWMIWVSFSKKTSKWK